MILRWFLSSTVRQATNLRRHVQKAVNTQRDLLSPQAVEKITAAMATVRSGIASHADKKLLKERMADLEKTTAKWLQPCPHASLRENVEVVLVAVTVAVAIHTFFLKPFKIPTGSMQPTLYGIVTEDLRDKPDVKAPTGLSKLLDFWFNGNSYYHKVAKTEGTLEEIQPVQRIVPFIRKQRLRIGGEWYDIWSPPDELSPRHIGVNPQTAFLLDYAGVEPGHLYRKGDDILKVKVFAGDHLFVDRFTYNFRPPKRGEIIVFETKGIKDPRTGLPAMPQDQFYVKRLVAFGREAVQIGDDRHVIINSQRLDQRTPRFENVYSFDPKRPPRESQYSGHLNDTVAAYYGKPGLALLFPDQRTQVLVRPNHCMVMGDNTLNSSDSRTWGDFSRANVIGKYCCVYWPFSDRFGWVAR